MAKRPRWRTEANETAGGFVTESLKIKKADNSYWYHGYIYCTSAIRRIIYVIRLF